MKNNDYEVGYRKPPKHSQFKKGHSGNPGGRTKKNHESLETLIIREFEKEISIIESGSEIKMTKKEVLARVITDNAIKLNPAALKIVLPLANVGNVPENRPIIYIPDNGRDPDLTKLRLERQAELGYTDEKGKLLPPYDKSGGES